MPPAFRISLLAGTVALLAAPGLAQTSRSPFLPPSGDVAQAATENAPLQFCGYMGAGENARYCVFDPSKRRSVWLRVGDEAAGVRVDGFDSENRTVTVVQGGRSMVLRLQSPTPGGGQGGSPSGPLPVAGQMPSNNAIVNSVVANPTPADEAKRLEAVAAEVRRRRALRQAAAQQQQQQQQQTGAPNPR